MRTQLGKLLTGGVALGMICLGFVGVNSSGAARVFTVAIAKAFGAPSVAVGGTTSLTFTIDNVGATEATGVDFTDPLPVGLQFVTGAGITDNCDTSLSGRSAVFTTASLLTVTNDGVPALSICTIVVTVTGVSPGVQLNQTTALTSSLDNGSVAFATIVVVAPPILTKAFGAPTIPLGGATSLTFTLSNPNTTVALTGIGFTDVFPVGLVLASATTNTCGGALSFTPSSVSLSGVTISASSSCTLVISVHGVAPGVQNNVTSAVTSTNGGTGLTASASITVLGPPTIAKAFGAPSIAENGTTSLTFTISNPNTTTALTGVGDIDVLPAGLVVATPNGLTGTCGGGTITATAGAGQVTLVGATLAPSSTCTFSVNVKGGASPVSVTNTTSAVTSTNAGTGNSASANLNIGGGPGGGAALPPVITKAFGAATIPLGGSTSMTFTITNPAGNTISLSGIGFTDSLPAGLVISTPNGSSSTCGGTLTDPAGGTAVSLSGVTLAHGVTCTISMNVTGTAAGTQTNVTSVVTSTQAGPGGAARAILNVVAPPTISKSFSPSSIVIFSNSTLSFTITNPSANAVGLTGVSFSDALPGGLRVATPNHESDNCGGSVTAAPGSGSISLSGGSLGVDASCTISVDVTATSLGAKNNVTSTVTSNEGGTGNTASATLDVGQGEGGGGGCNSGTGSATSSTPGGSAAAVNDGSTATGINGIGTVTIKGYEGDPVGPTTGFIPACFFDVSESTGATFTSLTINDCLLNTGTGLVWWNPAANGGAGAWLAVSGDPGPTFSPGLPSCLSVTLDSTTSPNLTQLGGTVFASTVSGGAGTSLNGDYDLVGSDGGVFVFGNPSGFFGSLPGLHIHVSNIVGIVPTADARGYFLVGSDGGVFAFGDATFAGSLPKLGIHVGDIVGIVPTSDDRGYFLVGRDGGVFSFGDAPFENSLPGQGIHVSNIVGIAATPDNGGYWLVSSTGTVYALGDAHNDGSSTAGSIVSIASTPDGGGYWLTSASGGVFTYGDAGFHNSLPGLGVHVSDIVSLVPSSDGGGYLLIGRDGGVFAFGDATFPGSLPGLGIHVSNIVGAVPAAG